MTGFKRLLAMAGVGVLGAISVTGVLAGPGGVLGGGGPDQPAASFDVTTPDSVVAFDASSSDETEVVGDVIDCPSGEDTHFKFEQSGDGFEVTGTLVSFDGTTIVVTGPEGDVTAAVDPGAEVKGDPQPGDPVKVEGAVLGDGSFVAHEIKPACEPVEDPNDQQDEADSSPEGQAGCPSGENTQAKFEQDDDEFELKGTLVSFDGTTIVVTGPEGDVTATLDADAEVEGDPQPGDPVEVEGKVLDDGSLVAREIESACDDEDADEHESADDSSSSEDEDSDEGHSESHDSSSHDDGEDESHDGGSGDHEDED